MSSYNRENPFMYLLETKMDELKMKTEIMIKEMIKTSLISSFIGISYIVCYILNRQIYNFIYLTLLILFTILCMSEIKKAVINVKSKDVHEKIFGNQYQHINLNTEELLLNINHYNDST